MHDSVMIQPDLSLGGVVTGENRAPTTVRVGNGRVFAPLFC
jgi:hypothetical protein